MSPLKTVSKIHSCPRNTKTRPNAGAWRMWVPSPFVSLNYSFENPCFSVERCLRSLNDSNFSRVDTMLFVKSPFVCTESFYTTHDSFCVTYETWSWTFSSAKLSTFSSAKLSTGSFVQDTISPIVLKAFAGHSTINFHILPWMTLRSLETLTTRP